MSALRSALHRYVAMRRGLGYQFRVQERRLSDFVTFMENRGATVITHKLALEWATLPPGRHCSWALRLCDVRGFARHLVNVEPHTEVPPVRTLPPIWRAKPYLYTDEESRGCWPRRWTCRPSPDCGDGPSIACLGFWPLPDCASAKPSGYGGMTSICGRASSPSETRSSPSRASCRCMPRPGRCCGGMRRAGTTSPIGEAARISRHRARSPPVDRIRSSGLWKLSRRNGLRGPADHTGPRLHDLRHRFAVQALLAVPGRRGCRTAASGAVHLSRARLCS